MNKTYLVLNENDPNHSFEVNSSSECDAAIDALSILGWNLFEGKQQEEPNPDQYEFEF